MLAIPALWYAGRPADLGVTAIVMAVWKYVLASALAGSVAGLLIRHIPSLATAAGWSGALSRSLTVSLAFATLYLGAVVLLHGGFEPIRGIAMLAGDMVPGRFSRSTQHPLGVLRASGTSG